MRQEQVTLLESWFVHDLSTTSILIFFQEFMFYFAGATTVVFWGMASDRFGRRSILIFGPLGLSITMLGFGASKQFSSLIMFRFLQGVFKGNMGMSLIQYN